MKDNFFSSYNKTRFIVDNHHKFSKIAVMSSGVVLILPLFFGFLRFLSNTVDAYQESVDLEISESVVLSEKTVSAEEEFYEVIAEGSTVSIEERSRIIKKVSSEIQSADRRELVLRAFFETQRCSDGSIPPLADYARELVESSDKYGLDWRYTTAISGVETWFGCAGAADSYKNAWGYGGGPATRFHYDSWPEGIDAFTKGFVNGYGTNINWHRISSYYTTGLPGTNDRWANGVETYLYWIDEIDNEL